VKNDNFIAVQKQFHFGFDRPLTKLIACAKLLYVMKNKLLPLAAAALLAFPLAACDNKTETVTGTAPDPQAEELANSTPVVLPPAMKASVTFRCKDHSLVYVDFFSGDKQALLKTTKDGTANMLTTDKVGDTLTADGYSMTGTPKAITLAQPGKGSQTCKT